jgi:hypothetical protein
MNFPTMEAWSPRNRNIGRYVEFMQNYAELHAGRCSIDIAVLENLYVDAEIAFLSRTEAQ